jgi:hypothetical protein
MGRFPHGTWTVWGWPASAPGILLLGLVALVLLALVVMAVRGRRRDVNKARVPLVELLDQEQEIVLVVELPGVSQDEIKLDVEGDVVLIQTHGERRYATSEILPDPVEAATLYTQFQNGLLTIHLTKQGYGFETGPTVPEPAASA